MSRISTGHGPFGPNAWQQTSWDCARGGQLHLRRGGRWAHRLRRLVGRERDGVLDLVVCALGLVAAGLLCVGSELGRPLRAIRVLRNPRTSWMARESWTALALFPAGLLAAAGISGWAWIAAALAVFFVYCQARMLQAAKGIPAWREPLLRPLVLSSGLAEGGGVFLLSAPLHGAASAATLLLFASLVLVRGIIWVAYRRRLASRAAAGALRALDPAGRLLLVAGTLLPLLLLGAGIAGVFAAPLVALGGLLAALCGAWLKLVIVTRAGFNQGFALAHMPVRGTRG